MANENMGITIVGLGPSSPDLLTRQAWDWLSQCTEVYVRTAHHPTVAGLPGGLQVHSFDDLYDAGEDFAKVYAQIVDQVLQLGKREEGVTYAVPGHPYVAEATSPEIVRLARQQGIPVRVIEGVSFLEPTFTALQIDPYPQISLVDALELAAAHHPSFPPSQPALIAQIYSKVVAAEVKITLGAVYPDQHPVRLVHGAGTDHPVVEDLKLYEIDRSPRIGLLTSLYVPALAPDASFEAFQEIIAHLRAPEGCPWDREQTHQTLRINLLEETYEALTALDTDDPEGMREEFGDLLLQIVLHAQIASEYGEFTMEDVIAGIHQKIVRRHPHVFGNVQVKGAGQVIQNWEKIKEQERKENGKQKEKKGLLDGVPLALPSLTQAQEIQARAARVGFDWKEIEPVIDKVREELDEVLQANDEERPSELGDLLFAVVNLVRWYKTDAESVLRETNSRFRKRFGYVEQQAHAAGRQLSEMTLAEMDVFWEAAKDLE